MEEDTCLKCLWVGSGEASEISFGELEDAPVEGCGDVEIEAEDDGASYADVFLCGEGIEAAVVGGVADFVLAEEAFGVKAEGPHVASRLVGHAGADEEAMELASVALDAEVDAWAEAVAVPLGVDSCRADDGSGVWWRSLFDGTAKHGVAADLYRRVSRVGRRIVWSWISEGWIERRRVVDLAEATVSCGKPGQS